VLTGITFLTAAAQAAVVAYLLPWSSASIAAAPICSSAAAKGLLAFGSVHFLQQQWCWFYGWRTYFSAAAQASDWVLTSVTANGQCSPGFLFSYVGAAAQSAASVPDVSHCNCTGFTSQATCGMSGRLLRRLKGCSCACCSKIAEAEAVVSVRVPD
jgi:hypothetical protein